MERTEDLALMCFDGDPKKAEALLELLELSKVQLACSMPKVEMQLPSEKCYWEKSGCCWKDVPDSFLKCKKPCKFFKTNI